MRGNAWDILCRISESPCRVEVLVRRKLGKSEWVVFDSVLPSRSSEDTAISVYQLNEAVPPS